MPLAIPGELQQILSDAAQENPPATVEEADAAFVAAGGIDDSGTPLATGSFVDKTVGLEPLKGESRGR